MFLTQFIKSEFALLLMCILFYLLGEYKVQTFKGSNFKPKKYGSAVQYKDLNPKYGHTRKKIVLYHNFFRTKVQPPAKDMLILKWHPGAAKDAQRWADSCQLLTHDNVTGRWVNNYGSCGQNIFVSNVQVPWFFAIRMWYLERLNFTYGGENDIELVGHYTQMVWYSTHEVGCGINYCKKGKPWPYYNYVCNYCPIGNHLDRLNKPYKTGTPCGRCKGACKYKKLCTNSCPYADQWVNCKELNRTWHHWLCKGKQQSMCLATCKCSHGNKIH